MHLPRLLLIFFFPPHAAFRILIPQPRIRLCLLHWEAESITELPGKPLLFLSAFLKSASPLPFCCSWNIPPADMVRLPGRLQPRTEARLCAGCSFSLQLGSSLCKRGWTVLDVLPHWLAEKQSQPWGSSKATPYCVKLCVCVCVCVCVCIVL